MIAEPAPLYREATGDGPPVLLAHGFSGSARNWRPQIRGLSAHHRVLTYDLRGHARSPAPHDAPERYTAEAFVADLGDVLDAEGIERAVVGGLSLGAGVALAFARRHPERVRGLILASLPAGGERSAIFSGSALDFAAALEAEGCEAAGARFVWGPGSGLDERGARLVRQGFLEHDPVGLAQGLRGALPEIARAVDAEDLAQRVTMPVLLVAGSEDAASLAVSQRLAARLPQARLEVIDGAGHVVNLAAPAAFNALVADFIAGLPD